MADEIETFHKTDLPNLAFPVLEDIRRQGKLCDVTLKVHFKMLTDIKCTCCSQVLIFCRFAIITLSKIENKMKIGPSRKITNFNKCTNTRHNTDDTI